MAKIASVTAHDNDHSWFVHRAEDHKKRFVEAFLDSAKGIFKDGINTDHTSLHANMFPLAFGLAPLKYQKSVVAFIKSRHMACSVYGAQYLLEALYNAGAASYAVQLMTSEERRSWLNMLKVGSSMTTEAWDEYYKPNLTWNHAWATAPANIIARKMMGVEPTTPGFGKFKVCPQPGELKHVNIKIPCVRGTIGLDLRRDENRWQLVMTVPGNTEAELWIPSNLQQVIIDNHKVLPNRKQKNGAGQWGIYALKAGTHQVSATR